MRPPETRSRRQSDPHQLPRVTKLTRLTNGFAKDDHVTTRSQAKSSKKSKSRLSKIHKQKLTSPSSKVSPSDHSNTSSPNNNDKNCSRLNGLVTGGGRLGRLENQGRRNLNCNGLSHGGGKNNGQKTSTITATAGNGSPLLFTHHRYQHFEGQKNGGPKTEKERVALQRAVAAEKRADRAKKRRSALWVLNCEAESFLFGETAAEKHEVVLPPLSPPKKRRRIRANELKSSINGSNKLRSPTPTSKEVNQQSTGYSRRNDNTSASSTRSPPTQKNSSKNLFLDLPGKDLSLSLSVNVDDSLGSVHQQHHHHRDPLVKDEILSLAPSVKEDELTSISSPLSSVYSCMGSPSSISNLDSSSSNSNSHSVRIKSILTSMDLKFSFEDVPTDEVWYSTFQRQENPETSEALTKARSYDYYNYGHPHGHNHLGLFSTSSPPALLPYETKLLNSNHPRSLTRGRLSRLPRKSPRCHASTLAILSSLKKGGRNRNSVLLPQSSAAGAKTATPIPPLPSPSSSPISPPIPKITIDKPAEEELQDKTPGTKQSMVTRKLSKSFCKAKASRLPHRNNKLSTLKGKNSPAASSTSSSLSSSQNQLTISSWRLGANNKSSTLPPVSPPMLSSRPQSPTPSPTSPQDKCPHRIRDISATQYLWDSIQLLSDPYVIQVLASERTGKSPPAITTTTTTINNNHCKKSSHSVKTSSVTLKSNQLFLRNSRKDQEKDVCTDQDRTCSCRQHAGDNFESTALGSCHSFSPLATTGTAAGTTTTKNSKLIPTPKSSPKNNNLNNNNYYINGVQLGKNLPCSHSRHCKYKQGKVSSCPSPQSSPNSTKNAKLNNSSNQFLHHHNNNKNTSVEHCNTRNGIHTHYPRKSPRNQSPIVLVSDIFKGGNLQTDGKTTTLRSADTVATSPDQQEQFCNNNNGLGKNSGRSEQKLLFLLEGIP